MSRFLRPPALNLHTRNEMGTLCCDILPIQPWKAAPHAVLGWFTYSKAIDHHQLYVDHTAMRAYIQTAQRLRRMVKI
jgi:hypothetical protein